MTSVQDHIASADTPPLDVVLVDDMFDQSLRCRPGERLHRLFEEVVDRLARARRCDAVAVSTASEDLTYGDLDARANALARFLAEAGAGPGDRIGLLFDTALPGYVGMLAVLKLHAAYVPLDVGFPDDRLRYILDDARVAMVITESHLRHRCADLGEANQVPTIAVDEEADRIAAQPAHRLTEDEAGTPVDELAYVIYTSGSTGVPKGVAIEHASICNFVRVADEVYGVAPTDRMYQGMTIAFDFSVEEIWVAWMAGATLVPKPGKTALVGADLRDFIIDRGITALSCVPTLLATIESDIPSLRFLLVSGEACPQDLIGRWARPGRRFLNVYGPTEATVTATWTTLSPDRRVTIGVPLPTYSVLILDPDHTRALPRGDEGEIAIAGIALSPGYLNRPDQTARAFIDDTLGVPNNPSGRLYRTGDLGRVTPDGEIEYLGRIDTQVKIRGYRIELTEIESVLLQHPHIAAAVVQPYGEEAATSELAAYVVRRTGAPPIDVADVVGRLRDRLPGYMIPAYLDELDALPLLPSDKVDRKALPAPTGGRVHAGPDVPYVAPDGPVEQALADALAQVLNVDSVSARAHFFDDLAATSILMAAYCARLRQVPGLESVRISDIYQHPTVAQLAATFAQPDAELAEEHAAVPGGGTVAPTPGRPRGAGGVVVPSHVTASSSGDPTRRRAPVSTLRYAICGVFQALVLSGYIGVMSLPLIVFADWLVQPSSVLAAYGRACVYVAAFAGYSLIMPIVVKWVFIGRWTPREIPVWSAAYLRFWTVRMLMRINPIVLFVGSPLAVVYLRALGAKIGKRVVLLTPTLPVCTDLLTIGSDTVISRGAMLNGYRADAGVIRTGRVTIGSRVYVGGQSVLDIDTSIGNYAQLGHASSLLPGQAIPAGEAWHGVPARRTDSNFRPQVRARVGALRPFVFGLGQLLGLVLGVGPILIAAVTQLLQRLNPGLVAGFLGVTPQPWGGSSYAMLVALTAILFVVSLPTGLLLVCTVPRLLALGVRPGRTYPLYGLAYVLHRTVNRLTNVRFFNQLFGDSVFVVGFLSRLGYRLKPVVQTGSNFGVSMSHETPYLAVVGHGTVCSDGIHFANTDYTTSAFRCDRTALGASTFVGNSIYLPIGAALGDDVLLATKVMIPIDGPPRRGIGLLGSPSFEIPMGLGADAEIAERAARDLPAGLRRKTRHNIVTMLLFLLNRLVLGLLMVVVTKAAFDLYRRVGLWTVPLTYAVLPYLMTWWSVLIERASLGFRRLRPRHVSIYDPYFWAHERYWKLSISSGLALFDGTPLKSWYLRGLGVTVGRRLFDDGCGVIEKSMTSIGDDCTLNAQSILQGHSLENSVLKSDGIRVGDRVTLAPRAFVHYGTDVGDDALVETDSFLMKGEQVPSGQRWQGNPAGPAPSRRLPPAPGSA